MFKNKTNVLIAVLTVLVLGGGAYLLFANMGGEGSVARKSLELSKPKQVAPAEATLPKVVHDPASGITYISYVVPAGEDEDSGQNIFLKSSADGGQTWSEAAQVNKIDGFVDSSDSAPQQMAIGPDGEVYVTWDTHYTKDERYEYGKSSIRFASSNNNGESFEVVTIGQDVEDTTATRDYHNLTVAPDGKIYLATLHSASFDTEGRSVRLHSSADGGQTWSEGADVDTNACPCCRPALAADSDNNVYVGWRKIYDNDGGTTIRDNVVARSTDGGETWSQPVKYHDNDWKIDGCPHAGPSLEMGSDGQLHAAWFTGNAEDIGIHYATSKDNGQTWGEPIPVFTPGYTPVTEPEMLLASDGSAWITYDDLRSSEDKQKTGGIDELQHHGDHEVTSTVEIVQITAEGQKVVFPETTIEGENGDLTQLKNSIGLLWKDKDGKIYFSTF